MSCPLCGKTFKETLTGYSRYWYCPHCTLAKRKHFSHAHYTDEYYAPSSSIARKLFIPIERFFYFLRTLYVADAKKITWIDLGAGDGGYLNTVPATKKIGVEISRSGRARMKQMGITALSDQDFLRMKGENADIISFWHMLEHTDKPWVYIRTSYRNLRRGGKIVVAVPNMESLEYRFFGTKWFHLVPQYHLWHFAPKSISKMLRREGFRIESIDYWSLEHHPTGILQTFINATSGTDAALQKLVKRADGGSGMNSAAVLWSLFWLTLGLPAILLFWLVQVAFKRSGTIVIVASKKP